MKIGLPARSADLVKEGNAYTVTSGACMDSTAGERSGEKPTDRHGTYQVGFS